MMDSDNSVLEIEIANLLNRSNDQIPLKRTTVHVRNLLHGRRSCRIEISAGSDNRVVKAGFEDFIGEGFFRRAERSLALQLEPDPVTVSTISVKRPAR